MVMGGNSQRQTTRYSVEEANSMSIARRIVRIIPLGFLFFAMLWAKVITFLYHIKSGTFLCLHITGQKVTFAVQKQNKMSHDTHNAHSTENKTIISFKNSFWLVIILVFLFIAALNFIQVESAGEDEHGGHEATTHETHKATGHEATHEAAPAHATEAAPAAEHAATEEAPKAAEEAHK